MFNPAQRKVIMEKEKAKGAGAMPSMHPFQAPMAPKPPSPPAMNGLAALKAYFDGGKVAKDEDSKEEQPTPILGGGRKPMNAAFGAKVPGKAQVPGDAPQNDTVMAKLSPGEVVLPRSVTQAPQAADKAKKYMLLHKCFGGKV